MIYYDIVFLLNFDMGQVQQCLIGAYNPGPGNCWQLSFSKRSPSWNRPKSAAGAFIGVILLPIVGNAAEHATAVTVAAKGKMDTWWLKSGSGEEFGSERLLLK